MALNLNIWNAERAGASSVKAQTETFDLLFT